MLKKLPLLAALFLAGVGVSQAQEKAIVQNGSEIQLNAELSALETGALHSATINGRIPTSFVEARDNVIPQAMMAEEIEEEVVYATWNDTITDGYGIEFPDGESYLTARWERPSNFPSNLNDPNVADTSKFEITGFVQFSAPFNPNDPNSTFTIDTIGVVAFQLEDYPALQSEWVMFPFYLSEEVSTAMAAGVDYRINFFDTEQVTFTQTNGGLQYYVIPNDSLTYAARSENGLSYYFQHLDNCVVPSNVYWGYAILPLDAFSSLGAANQDQLRLFGAFEYWADQTEALGGWVMKRPTESGDYTNMSRAARRLFYGNQAELPVKLRNQPMKMNYASIVGGTYRGEEPTSVESADNGLSGFTLGTNFPNPATTVTNVPFAVETPGTYIARVVNAMGEVVTETTFANMATGSYNWDFDVTNFANGTYFYSLIAPNGQAVTRAFVVAK